MLREFFDAHVVPRLESVAATQRDLDHLRGIVAKEYRSINDLRARLHDVEAKLAARALVNAS